MVPLWRSIVLHRYYRENVKNSSCLKPQGLELCYVASPSGPLPFVQIIALGPKMSPPWGSNVLHRLYRENVKKTSCLKPHGLEP